MIDISNRLSVSYFVGAYIVILNRSVDKNTKHVHFRPNSNYDSELTNQASINFLFNVYYKVIYINSIGKPLDTKYVIILSA